MPKAHPAEIARYAKALAMGGGNFAETIAAAERERATPRVVEAVKSGSPGAALSDPNWAGALAPAAGEMSVALIESIRPRSVFYQMAALAVPTEFHARAVALALVTADPHTETEWLPVRSATLTPAPLSPVSVGSIIVVSTELARSTDPASFRALRRELEQGAIRATDARALGIALDGITPIQGAGAPLYDLAEMLTAVSVTGAATLLFVAAPDTAITLATLTPAPETPVTPAANAGTRFFPGMSPVGGEVLAGESHMTSAV